MKLTDLDKMPFGRWKNLPMQDVPVGYLHWFWHEVKAWNEEQVAVMNYIRENIAALKTENPDLIWTKK